MTRKIFKRDRDDYSVVLISLFLFFSLPQIFASPLDQLAERAARWQIEISTGKPDIKGISPNQDYL